MRYLRTPFWFWIVILAPLFFSHTLSAADTVSFITFGDWGTGTVAQKTVARAATQYCHAHPCQVALTLGDNFYENGVKSVADSKWQRYYRDIYQPLNLPFYAILGNHDERGNIQAQIDYAKVDSSWHMPGAYYSVAFPQNAPAPILEIFVINNGDRKFQDDEKAWLTQALAKSRARWKLLALHIPIISNGKHGDNDSKINDALVPIICGKIDVVLSGHDHNFAHLKGPWGTCKIDQLIVGTGGRTLYKADKTDSRVFSSGSYFGFGWMQASADILEFQMITDDGAPIYIKQWKK
jgi:acid phosphatase